ncbi:MAG: Omp28-related outer membrane protein [Bacteroidales bacterium]|nr:Omp28-related outer membrane protein [Bacteroidales bacterium]
MTKKMKFARYILTAFSFIALAACSGTVDPDSGTENKDPMKEVPEGVLRIFADKTEISADGNEEVTFTVMFGSEDVSNAKTLQLVRTFNGEEKYMAYGVNKYSTVTAGEYTFSAKYYYGGNHFTDNAVVVNAKQFFTGEEKDYRRRYLGTLFTSTGCNSCPLAARGLKDLQAANPDEIIIAAFHADMTVPDPMTIAATYEFQSALGGFQGLPAFFWNMREDSYTGGSAFTESFAAEKEAYNTYSGVTITTTYDESSSNLVVDLGITSNMPAVFRYMAILVEDNIPATGDYAQNGQGKDYIHYNVVRQVLTGVNGDKINDNLPLTEGVEAKSSKSVTLSKDWNADNMRVIVAAMTSEDGGYNWTVNNVNECKVGESVSYLYAE